MGPEPVLYGTNNPRRERQLTPRFYAFPDMPVQGNSMRHPHGTTKKRRRHAGALAGITRQSDDAAVLVALRWRVAGAALPSPAATADFAHKVLVGAEGFEPPTLAV
jgi:hypothetical protein